MTTTATCDGAPRRGRPIRTTLLVAGAALLCAGLAASLTAAAPTYAGWSAPVNVGPIVNSAVVPGSTGKESGPAVSPDGLSLYFYSDRPGGLGGDDIWVSQRPTVNGAWGVPRNLGSPINSATADNLPAFSADGHWLFFTTARDPRLGATDIWSSWRPDVHDDFGWQAPTNLGAGVNSVAADSAPTYFENGGHPQLLFGSARPGGPGGADLYVSNRQDDGTWGTAALVPELNSTGVDNRPSIRPDGLEIFFYSDRLGGSGLGDVWVATRATVGATWSTPVNLGPTVNSSADDVHPSIAADGRTLFFSSTRPGGLGGTDVYVTARDAVLIVTANDRSRLFGQANPPLTTTITGFVGGDTSAVVLGTAACTTTATPTSPAGAYPITCTAGSLAASGYSFGTFVAGTLTVGYTSPCVTGTRTGPLTVAAGEAICIAGTQAGPVTVSPGGALDVEGGRIAGPLTATGATGIRLCGATVTGPLTIVGSTGLVLVGGDPATAPCDANTITGPATLTGNTAGVELNGNTVVGPLRITGNTGPVHAAGNRTTGPVTIQT